MTHSHVAAYLVASLFLACGPAGSQGGGGDGSNGVDAPSDGPPERVTVSMCAMACQEASDCCAQGAPDCPGAYPSNWRCDAGYCALGGCASNADCTFGGVVDNLECHAIAGTGACFDPCTADVDCAALGGTCTGEADDGTRMCEVVSSPSSGCSADADCADNGRCDADGLCVCAGADDCRAQLTTPGGWGCREVEVELSATRRCHDGAQNAGESGVDCGGPCGACTGAACSGDEACASGACAGGSCVGPSCSDGIRNGTETGVDCGGACVGCGSCDNAKRDQDESDVDCGGTRCGPCAVGDTCAAARDCESDRCVGGQCDCRLGSHSCGGTTCFDDDDATRCGGQCAYCQPSGPGTAVCIQGQCATACAPGYHLCAGTCVDSSAVQTCGARCTPCPPTPHATATCDGASCGFACKPGYHLCGDECVEDDSVAACGWSCASCPASPAHGETICVGGQCRVDCELGYVECNGQCIADVPGDCVEDDDRAPLVINEIDYDQPGVDATEFVEIHNPTDRTVPLADYTLVFLNPTGGATPPSVQLQSAIPPFGYVIVCSWELERDNNFPVAGNLPNGGIQNGPNDGVRLMYLDEPVDTFMYEVAAGSSAMAYVEGTRFSGTDSDEAGRSLGRCPDGYDSNDNGGDFERMATTPGAPNACP